MYMGERLDARPMPKPPSRRYHTNAWNEPASAVPTAEPTKNSPAAISSRFRPSLSLKRPESTAPIMHPTSALLIAQPTSAAFSSSPKWRMKNGLAPPMTTQS